MKNQKTHILILTLLVISCMFACKKDEIISENDPEPENTSSDSITYTELNPSIQISSVDSLVPHGSGCGDIPSPSDSTASVSIDIDNDNVADFTLTCRSWYNAVSASGPCANYNTSIMLSGTSNENQVAITDDWIVVEKYVLNDVIDNSQQWSNTALLMMSSATALSSTDFNDTVYIGLKMNTVQGDYFGWIYIDKNGYDVKVISYAINETVNSSINAGQTE